MEVILRAGVTSLVLGTVITGTKFAAYFFTHSAVILSDALESIANVAAAAFGLFAVSLARKPPDENHPYGHGKVEYLSAGFEGGMIFVAGALILWEAGSRLLHHTDIEAIPLGIALTAIAATLNGLLGTYLVRVGKTHLSPAIEADGRHILTDVITSAAAIVGLVLVVVTGKVWLDPVLAIIAAIYILWTGVSLLRVAVAGVMDELHPEDAKILEEALSALHEPYLLSYSDLRTRRHGNRRHVDLTIHVSGNLTVKEGHDVADRVEAALEAALPNAEVLCHVEPKIEEDGSGPPRSLRRQATR